MAQAYDTRETLGGKPVNPYMPAVPDPDHPTYFAKDGEGSYRFNAAGTSLEFLSNLNACKVVDLKPDVREVTIDLYLERGKTADPEDRGRRTASRSQGRPLPG